jgi:Ca2+-binding RTX toxin-like protein
MATINGTSNDDVLYALTNGDIVNALEGNDLLVSEGFDFTTLNGDAGQDVLSVSGSGNTLNGDGGSDQFYYIAGGGNILNGGEGDDVFSGVNFNNNTFNGDDGNDYASAAVGNNSILNGGQGNDFLAVGGDNNILNGGGGDDYLEAFFEAFDSGQPGTNVLLGGDGNDVLTAWYGGHLTGGDGNDRFVPIGTGGNTVITDFQHDTPSKSALQAEDVLSISWIDLDLDKPLNVLIGQGYLVVSAAVNVGGGPAVDTVVEIDTDGRAGPLAPTTIVTLLDTTLTTHGADMNNWFLG